MCGGVHYGKFEGLVSIERWSCSRGASCVVEYTMGRSRDWSLCIGGLVTEVFQCFCTRLLNAVTDHWPFRMHSETKEKANLSYLFNLCSSTSNQ